MFHCCGSKDGINLPSQSGSSFHGHLYLPTGTYSFIARSQGQVREQVGHNLELIAQMKKAHFFELTNRSPFTKETGETDIEKWQSACPLII